MQPPDFWQTDGLPARLLAPAAWLYLRATRLRNERAVARAAPVPLVCVGNLVVGGAGKTPVALSLADFLGQQDQVHFLTRGYGGRATGPLRVDPYLHTAVDVGDEALLLADVAPTWLARDRVAGARAAADDGATLIIMDDGFQNPYIHKDLSLLVVDGAVGFGNRRVIPAGPLRETIGEGLARADTVIIMGPDNAGVAGLIPSPIPILTAALVPAAPAPWPQESPVIAFAGIGRPQKFFDTIYDMGCRVISTHEFADHHPYMPRELTELSDEAARDRAVLVTTTKDWVRLPAPFRGSVYTLPVTVAWQNPEALTQLLTNVPRPT